MKNPESNLPTDILVRAVLSGKEYGWRRSDIAAVIEAAPSVGLAVIGGQAQFMLPEGTCELYWINFDPACRKPEEPWEVYLSRSSEESLTALQHVMSKDLVHEGVSSFPFLKEKQSQGIDLEQYLLFIAYFQTKEDCEQSLGCEL